MCTEEYTPIEKKLFARFAKSSKEFVIVLGTGASRPAGLPGWEGLRDCLLDRLIQYYKAIGRSDDEIEEEVGVIHRKTDLWDSFSILRRKLNSSDYEEAIKEQLSTKGKRIPELYKLIWDLDIAGIVTYNLDDFAFISNNRADTSHWREAHKYANYLHNSNNFVFHPHGVLSDVDSWVLTRKEKDTAYADPNFNKFMTALINTKHILIVGFNPKDQSFLDMLRDVGIAIEHREKTIFYLYPSENKTIPQDEYEKFSGYGIGIIPYQADETHSFLTVFFKNLQEQKKRQLDEQNYPLVSPKTENFTESDIPTPQEMWKYSYNTLRRIMGSALSSIISSDKQSTSDDIEKINNFYKQYSKQLHQAWYYRPDDTELEANMIYDYKLIRKVGSGSFGGVYEAEYKNGERCAIKLLLNEVISKDGYLNCFRRGVHTMKILSENSLQGAVRFHEAFEVPACIVMDYVNGLTLREVIDNKALSQSHREVSKKLEIILDVARIINNAHILEDRVLHRDIKPENIILKDFYYLEDDDQVLEIKIVDFDLSWHRGAEGETVAATGSVGFVAPEQLPGQSRDRTKNAAVDVYSIGIVNAGIKMMETPVGI
jgi:hypothetical protein